VDLTVKNRVEHAVEPTGEYQVDGLQAQVIVAWTLKRSPPAMSCVSPAVFVSTRMATACPAGRRQYGASSRTHRLQVRAIRCSGLRYCL